MFWDGGLGMRVGMCFGTRVRAGMVWGPWPGMRAGMVWGPGMRGGMCFRTSAWG